jgi:hypothetical protein
VPQQTRTDCGQDEKQYAGYIGPVVFEFLSSFVTDHDEIFLIYATEAPEGIFHRRHLSKTTSDR